jgi:hypothetical protein
MRSDIPPIFQLAKFRPFTPVRHCKCERSKEVNARKELPRNNIHMIFVDTILGSNISGMVISR